MMSPEQAKFKHDGLHLVEMTLILTELKRSFDAYWVKHDPRTTSYVWFEKPVCLKNVEGDAEKLLEAALFEFERSLKKVGWRVLSVKSTRYSIEVHLDPCQFDTSPA